MVIIESRHRILLAVVHLREVAAVDADGWVEEDDTADGWVGACSLLASLRVVVGGMIVDGVGVDRKRTADP